MLQNYNKYKIAKLFFQYPTKEFHLRELSSLSRIAPPSTKKYLKDLEQEGFIIKEKKIYPVYKADRINDLFKEWKVLSTLFEIRRMEFLKIIRDQCLPDAVILFGSASRGEDIEQSDIDIAIIGEEIPINLTKSERALKRKISLLFISNFHSLSNELKNNIINGVRLYGYLKIY